MTQIGVLSIRGTIPRQRQEGYILSEFHLPLSPIFNAYIKSSKMRGLKFSYSSPSRKYFVLIKLLLYYSMGRSTSEAIVKVDN